MSAGVNIDSNSGPSAAYRLVTFELLDGRAGRLDLVSETSVATLVDEFRRVSITALLWAW